MKKIALSLFLITATTFFLAYAKEPGAGCPTCVANECNGYCVPIFGADGKVSHYECHDPQGSNVTKDCKRSVGGGGGIE